MSELDAELGLALELALLGGAIAAEQRSRGPRAWRKRDGTWVTEADRAVEAAIRAQIAAVLPEHNVLGEEGGLRAAGGGPARPGAPTWIVDPIDGTSNYVAGHPVWATLVAFRIEEQNAAGVVHAPELGETYAAARGGGATLNGRPIRVAACESADDAVLLCCGAAEIDSGRDPFLAGVARRSRRGRSVGDFRGHMLVAGGAAHAMVEPCALAVWDVAALEPIVTEAGGRLTALGGDAWSPGRPCLTAAEPLHSALAASFDRRESRRRAMRSPSV